MQERKRKVVKRKAFIIRMTVLALPLVLLLVLAQTAFAENTYVITDGDRVLVHTSSATDPAAVLNEAGLALGADDTYSTQPGAGVSEITVQRGQNVTVRSGSQTMTVSSKAETVRELLARLNIPVDENTTVSAPLESVTSDAMEIVVSRTIRATETYSVAVAHETVYCYDRNMPSGTETVLVKGVDGELMCTADVVYVDGKETSRTVLSQTVTIQPVDEIIAVGTGSEELQPGYVPTVPVIGDGYIITTTGEVLTYTDVIGVECTAYSCDGRKAFTYSGTIVEVGSVAVDPSVIPHGTRMFIVSNDGQYVYGVATAEDTGGLIKDHIVDLYFDTTSACWQFGRRNCTIYVLAKPKSSVRIFN